MWTCVSIGPTPLQIPPDPPSFCISFFIFLFFIPNMDLNSAIALGKAGYSAYKTAKSLKRTYDAYRSTARSRPVKRRRYTAPPSTSTFNSGYTIVSKKARNVKRKYTRRMKRKMRKIKKKVSSVAAKITRASVEKLYKRLVLMNEMELGRGRVLMPNLLTSTSGYGFVNNFLPLQLIDITDVDHSVSNPWYQLYYTTAESVPGGTFPNYFFNNNIWCKLSGDGETANNDTTDPGSSNASDAYLYGTQSFGLSSTDPLGNTYQDTRKWHQNSVKVDLMLYGQSNQDTMYRFDVVRFDPRIADLIHQQFNRDSVETGAGPESTGFYQVTAEEWKTFWQSLVFPYVSNPLVKRPRPRRFMKILKTYKFKIPEQSSEFNRIPSVKTSFTIPINKVWSRYWHTAHLSNVSTTVDGDPENSAALNDTDYSMHKRWGSGKVHPKYRTYLMIRATNTDRRSVDSLEATNSIRVVKGQDPTYDINLSTSFTYVPKDLEV